jgi:hypothetical protein
MPSRVLRRMEKLAKQPLAWHVLQALAFSSPPAPPAKKL